MTWMMLTLWDNSSNPLSCTGNISRCIHANENLFTVGIKDQGKLHGIRSVWTLEGVEGRQKETSSGLRPLFRMEILKCPIDITMGKRYWLFYAPDRIFEREEDDDCGAHEVAERPLHRSMLESTVCAMIVVVKSPGFKSSWCFIF